MPRTVGVRVRVRSSEKSDSFAEVRFNLESSLKPETKFLLESASLSSSPRSVSPSNYCTDSNSGVASSLLLVGAWSLELGVTAETETASERARGDTRSRPRLLIDREYVVCSLTRLLARGGRSSSSPPSPRSPLPLAILNYRVCRGVRCNVFAH